MNTTRLYRFSPACHGLPSPSLLLPNWSIMCTPWNTNLQHGVGWGWTWGGMEVHN